MNNVTIRNHYDAFERIEAFGKKYGGKFAATSRAKDLFGKTAAVAAKMEEDGVKKLSGSSEFQGGTDAKEVAAELVREDLRAMRDTAEAISEAEGLPEFDDQFRMPRSSSISVLLTSAKAFHKDALPHKALFVEFELEEDFLEDLLADIALVEGAGDGQNEGRSDQVGGTAELSAQTRAGQKLRKQLLPIVRNKFKKDPGILAEWESAAHVVRPEKKKDDAGKKPA